MIGYVSRAFFHTLAGSRTLQQLASRYGMRSPNSFARRFIAGETIDEAIAAARNIEANGMMHTLDLLGESVATMPEADAATRAYLATFDRIVAAGIGRNVSLKLTQLGLTIDRATCVDNLRRILDAAAAHDFFVRVDMENSEYTVLVERGTYPAVATHDPDMIAATRAFASAKRVPADRYEFQMLYGIRRDLQRSLRDAGYRVRVYVPFGREWFPYFMRRLGERPANIGFVINGLLREG
ncbi:MAG: proline dehydrogenase family protein [Acidobacteria bacterium]|nr:proline dehydrogenase family protein [Acidobacteriota bacterium]